MGERFIDALVNGGDHPTTESAEALGKAAARMEELADLLERDGADRDAVKAQITEQATILATLKDKHDKEVQDAENAEARAQAKAALEMVTQMRSPSMGRAIGQGATVHPSMGGYKAGAFIGAVETLNAKDSLDSERQAAKAYLSSVTQFMTPEEAGSKATLGTTDATGGWIVPNAIVEPITKTGRFRGGVMSLVTRRTGMQDQYQVDIPFRRDSPNRAVIAPWGDTKENTNLVYEGYTATLYTLARIYDVPKQFVRKSRGAAEADVIDELQDAFRKGESYYTLRGSGSGEPYGLQTALALGGASTFTSSFSPATTLAGSVAKAIATAAGALAARDREASGALLSATGYWEMVSQGADAAGFWLAGAANGSPEGVRPGTLISPFGIPVTYDSQLAGSDDLIVGEWEALKVYVGEGFRIDSSDVAGERWDRNLVGFRGEEEFGLDARPAVFAGAFQFIADIIP